jgi:mRNA-degrading endonuclease RelE of RelBE toxin-antitoxin system
MSERYHLVLLPAARRALELRLPLAAATAVWEFCNGPLLDNPQRVGKPLGAELKGYHSARRGPYRVLYRIDDPARTVRVERIDHRADVHRT